MRVLIRTDASMRIGSGHVMRCGTLASALISAGSDVVFVSRNEPGNLVDWLRQQGFSAVQLPVEPGVEIEEANDFAATRAAASSAFNLQRPDWTIVDHYGLGTAWEREASTWSRRIMAIDDVGRAHWCDLLLDQNLSVKAHEAYSVKALKSCELLLGPDYALVRDGFAACRSGRLTRPTGRLDRIIVCMGGADASDETSKAVEGIALSVRASSHVDVVIGEGNIHRVAVQRACRLLGNVELHIQTSNMHGLMASADLAICGAGSITWERCVVGLPALVSILADNQAEIAASMSSRGVDRLLGWARDLSPQEYAMALNILDPMELGSMGAAASSLCDGRGAERVVKSMSDFEALREQGARR